MEVLRRAGGGRWDSPYMYASRTGQSTNVAECNNTIVLGPPSKSYWGCLRKQWYNSKMKTSSSLGALSNPQITKPFVPPSRFHSPDLEPTYRPTMCQYMYIYRYIFTQDSPSAAFRSQRSRVPSFDAGSTIPGKVSRLDAWKEVGDRKSVV